MKNKIIYDLKNKVKLRITGKNINRFLMRLYTNKIEVLKCINKSKEEMDIVIYEKDYVKIEDIKTIYNVEKLNVYGMIKIKKKLSLKKYLIVSIILCAVVFRFLTSIIFDIEIVYNDEDVRTFLKEELKNYGIKEKTFKKSYSEIERIKEDLLSRYKDKIEWLEIETKGTKYIVRVEMRIIKDKPHDVQNRNIVAKSDARILEIKAIHGQIIKEINSYVKKGDVIISGNIYDNDVVKDTVPALGTVYGETWYEIKVTYPFAYSEVKDLENKKTVYVLKFLNKNIELFNKNPFKTKKVDETVIFGNSMLPIQLVKQKQAETQVIEQILTTDEAIKMALEKAIAQVESNLKEHEYIINKRIINTNIKENELELNVFFSICENITDYQIIEGNELNVQ